MKILNNFKVGDKVEFDTNECDDIMCYCRILSGITPSVKFKISKIIEYDRIIGEKLEGSNILYEMYPLPKGRKKVIIRTIHLKRI
jgi:ribosomal protein L21E